MYFGKIKNTNEWGFDVFPKIFETYVQVLDSEYQSIVHQANSQGKLISGDSNGNPILVDPPEPLPGEIKRQHIDELKAYLSLTDWYVVRQLDDGKEMPSDIKLARESARQEISRLREELTEFQEEYSELPSNEYDENGDYIGG